MKNVVVRTLSGLVYIVVMAGAVLLGKWCLAALICVLAACGIYEYLRMNCKGNMPRYATMLDICAGVMLQLGTFTYYNDDFHATQVFLTMFLVLIMLRMVSQLYVTTTDPVMSLAKSLGAQVYVSLPIALIPLLYYQLASPHIVLAVLIFIWANDTGAFCVGSMIGRNKLFERISPKKTWEGFFGGLLFSIIAAFVMRGFFGKFFDNVSYVEMCELSILVSIFATFGDLVESMLKRAAGVKDSGNIIPGHGGMLDRIDSILLVIPAVVIFFVAIS